MPPGPSLIDLERLPVPGPHLVGRDAELARLDAAWADPATHVLSLVAFGGVGKSALVSRWLDGMAADGWRGAERVLGWSFFSQGSQGQVTSAEPFIDFVLRAFGDDDPTVGSPHDRGARLAGLTRQQRTLLVLDGVEPLQYGSGPLVGRLKDPGLTALLKGLATDNPGLCVVTTREAIADLNGFPCTAPRCDLEKLSSTAAVELLRLLSVNGKDAELRSAAEEFGRHALTLTLLGNYLRRAHGGDVRKRREVYLRKADDQQGGQASRIIAAYERWLGEGPELSILRLLGFFDRPADPASLAALRATPPIKGLNDRLARLADEDWRLAVANLREHGLLAARDPREPGILDAHPLVRAYFAHDLERHRPAAWRAGNLRLYEHLRQAAPDLPDTLDTMQPLYAAVLHGCRAGRQQEAFDEVYWRRIQRGRQSFGVKTLGAIGLELTALAAFFDRLWDRPAGSFGDSDQSFLLSQAGFFLRALGRLGEAVKPMQAGLDRYVAAGERKNASLAACNLSELNLSLGEVARAVPYGEQAILLAGKGGGEGWTVMTDAALADALHQAGRREESHAGFSHAEKKQAAVQGAPPHLYSYPGFRYCDLLLGTAEPEDGASLDGLAGSAPMALHFRDACEEVVVRATKAKEIAETEGWLFSRSLEDLTLGRVHLGLAVTGQDPAENGPAEFVRASEHLDRSLEGLRKAANEEFIARGLLARAALRRFRSDLAGAASDLDEALEIAEGGSMRLIECDAHLEWTRLHLQQGHGTQAREHLGRAAKLVRETGYGRREREVTWLERRLADLPPEAEEAPMKDFFISYNRADLDWAEWTAWTLEEAGYTVILQVWDFRPGGHFVLEMQKAATGTRKTLMVLSDAYLQAEYTHPEWEAAFVQDPRGDLRKLIPVRVARCSPSGLLKSIIYADLVGLTADEAKGVLLAAVSDKDRVKPTHRPAFPGSALPAASTAPSAAFPPSGRPSAASPASNPASASSHADAAPPAASFPGTPAPEGSQALAVWREKLDFLQEQEAVSSDPAQLFALRKQIEQAREKIQGLGG